MKIKRLIIDVKAVGSPARADSELFGVILCIIMPIQAIVVIREPL